MKTNKIVNNLEPMVLGLNKAADIVRSTMGAEGKTVIISDNVSNTLRFTKDGVSVAKSISLPDPIENIGAQVLISAAKETVKSCGDGTTLTSVLLQALVNGLGHALQEMSVNDALTDVNSIIKEAIILIKKKASTVEHVEDVYHIAKTSANSDNIGKLFKSIYTQVGFDSLVTLERSEYSNETYYEILKGVEFESGHVHSAFITDKNNNTCTYENVYIHLDEKPINNLTDAYKKILDICVGTQQPLVIIAPKFSDSFIRMTVMNKVNSAMPICLIQAPGFGEGVKKNYADIRAYLSEDNLVDKIRVTSHDFVIYNEDTPYLQHRLDTLKSLSETAKEWYDEKDYLERYHKLKQSTAIIYVAGITPEALEEEYDRIEDALGATKAAIRSGYVAGGGITFLEVSYDINIGEQDVSAAHAVALDALKAPFEQIIKNANVSPDTIIGGLEYGKGYNVRTKKFEDLKETGVIDPVDVLTESLKNAFASVKLLLNTSYTLYNEFEK